MVGIGATKGENGIYVQKLTGGADSKSHIAGEMFPMYGQALNIPADKNPKVQMKHMSAIVALKIVNQGDSKKENLANEKNETDKSSITINDITFAVPEYNSSAIKQTKIPIVGSFKVDPTSTVNSNSFTPVDDASSNSVSLDFTSTTIKPGESATFYVAVRPFDVSNSTLGGSEERTGLTLSITVNGSTRSVEIPAETKFEAGKVTTLRVPVKLEHPKKSDGIGSLVQISDNTVPGYINGETVDIYTANSSNNITIHALIADIIKAAPAGFYAATLKSAPSAMTVRKIDLEYPKGNNSYDSFLRYSRFTSELSKQLIKIDIGGILGIITYFLFPDGITRDASMMSLTNFIDPRTITFNGVINVNAEDWGQNILIMDEEPIHKRIGDDTINNLLTTKFVYTRGADRDYKPESPHFTVNKNTLVPSYEGLLAIVTENPANYEGYSEVARETAEALFYQIHYVIDVKVGGTIHVKKYIIDKDLNVHGVVDSIFKSPKELTEFLRTWKCLIEIQTYPYYANKDEYVENPNADKVVTKGILKDSDGYPKYGNPMYFWGIDVTTEEDKK